MENTPDFSIFVVQKSCRGLVKFIVLKEMVYFVQLGSLSVMSSLEIRLDTTDRAR